MGTNTIWITHIRTKMASQEFQRWEVSEPYIDLHCELGEGPYHEKESNSLRFVDIKKKQLLSFSLDEGPSSLKTLQLDAPLSVTADVEGHDPRERILLGMKYGMALLDRETGRYEYITKFEPSQDNERLRSNDGAADPHGRFWLGTMTDFGLGDFKPEGRILVSLLVSFSLLPEALVPCWTQEGCLMSAGAKTLHRLPHPLRRR